MTRARRWQDVALIVVVAVAAVLALAAPIGVVIGAARLVAAATMAVGAWLLVARVGAIDLAAGAMAGVGAVAAGIAAARLGVPVVLLLPGAAVAGAGLGAASGWLHGRVGRHLGAVTSLTLGVTAVAVWRGLPALGGRAGFHGVPFLAGTDAPSLVVAAVVLAAAVWVAGRLGRTTVAARAAVAAGAPAVARVLGGGPGDAARMGAAAGALLGIGGAVGAAVGGSAVADAHGPSLGVLLALAATLGRRSPLAAAGGAVALWGPAIVWPLAPVVGHGSPWLTTGLAALAWLALRTRPDVEVALASAPRDDTAEPPSAARPPGRLRADGVALPAGDLDVVAEPGRVTVVTGPNGAGKSTLLAVLGGQLTGPDVLLGEEVLPTGSAARARAGVARSWQHPPDVHPDDLVAAAVAPGDGDAARIVAWATDLLGPRPAGSRSSRAHASLVALAVRRPRLALLDEPAAFLAPASVEAFVHGLAATGAVVVVVEHRPEIVASAHAVIEVVRDLPVATASPAPPSGRAGRSDGVVEVAVDADLVTAASGQAAEITLAHVDVLRSRAARGSVRWRGRDVSRWPTHRRARNGLVVLGDAPVAPEVSVGDHLAALRGVDDAARFLATAPLLAGRADDPAGWLSGGERQVLSWLQTLAAQPAGVVLDGAARGMDAAVLAWADEVVTDWLDAGVCLLVRPGRDEERRWLDRTPPSVAPPPA